MTSLGLSRNAEAVYRVALAESGWTTDVLVEVAGARTQLADPDVRAAVEELLALRLLHSASAHPHTHLRTVAPGVVLEARVAAVRDAVHERQRELDRATEQLQELQADYTRAREAHVEHTIERLTGLDAVRSRLEQLAQGAQLEALSFMRGAQSPESMEASWPLDREALVRGVNLRSVYLHSATNDPATAAYLRRLDEAGGESRTVATLPLRLLIVDRTTAVVPIDPDRSSAGALVIRSRGVLAGLLALFESVWLTGRRASEPRRVAAVEVSDTEREILRILTTGATDEVVARQLGVSVRTVRRLTSVLMTRFASQSRFELGLRLGQQGWGARTGRRSGDATTAAATPG